VTKTPIKNTLTFVLIIVLLSSLYFLGEAVQGAEQFNRIYLWLFGASIIAVLILALIIIQRLVWLLLKRKSNEPGIKLTTRMVSTFIALSLPPVLIVYIFSTQFLNNYIDSWFDTNTKRALDNSLELGRIFLNVQTKQALTQTKNISQKLSEIDDNRQAIYLERYLDESSATSLTLVTESDILATANNSFDLTTNLPPQAAFRDVLNGNNYARIEPAGSQLQIRTLVRIENVLKVSSKRRFLQGFFSYGEFYHIQRRYNRPK